MTENRERPALSRELIAETAMQLTLDQPYAPLTLARLGAELDADPTAVYRHYRSRDELMLDLGDRLYREALDQYESADDWRTSLSRLAYLTRDVLLRRPALAAEVGTRFTGGPGERAGAELVGTIMARAGFDDARAKAHTRCFGELLMAHIVSTASYLSLPEATQLTDSAIAQGLYDLAPDPDPGPDVGVGQADDAFDLILSTYLAGLGAVLTDGPTVR